MAIRQIYSLGLWGIFGRHWLAVPVLLCLFAPIAHAQDVPVTAAIKAVYLTKFIPFVEWPAQGRKGAMTICILDDEDVGRATEIAARNTLGDTGGLAVRMMAADSRPSGCQILFIGSGVDTTTSDAALEGVANAPTLTVTDDADEGHVGIINFVIRDDRVRFEIDDVEALRHRLKISSKLLGIAVSVIQ